MHFSLRVYRSIKVRYFILYQFLPSFNPLDQIFLKHENQFGSDNSLLRFLSLRIFKSLFCLGLVQYSLL